MAYRIYTDATADMNDAMLSGLPEVEIVPMDVLLGDQHYIYGNTEGLTIEEFYNALRGGKFASTSQATPSVFRKYFEKALKEDEDILYLSFASAMSGMFQSACISAEELREEYPERTILCIDTLCAAVGEGFLVCEALRKQAEGMELDTLASWINENRLKICHWFTVDTFEHLKHGGRVSAATAVIGSTLNIKPLLRVTEEGALKVSEKPRGNKTAMKALLRKLEEGWTPELGKRIVIGHGDVLERASELRKKIEELYPNAEIEIVDNGAVIGAHTGPGMLALIYWGNNR